MGAISIHCMFILTWNLLLLYFYCERLFGSVLTRSLPDSSTTVHQYEISEMIRVRGGLNSPPLTHWFHKITHIKIERTADRPYILH
jgi:hypothetical protein